MKTTTNPNSKKETWKSVGIEITTYPIKEKA
jgi:hypothetical protein